MVSKEEIDALEVKHGRIAHVRAAGAEWDVVFRRPKRAEYKQFRSRSHNAALAPDALENVLRQCVVSPTPDAFDALLEEWPGIPEACAKAFLHLAGVAIDEDVK